MHAVHEGAVCLGYWPRTPGPTGEALNKGQRSFLSISSTILIFFNEVELRIPTDQLGTHLEFNPSHFIVEFIWIFFKSLLPESSEVFLLFPVVTKSLNQVHSKNKNKKTHNEQTLQASKVYTKWTQKSQSNDQIWSRLHSHWRWATVSVGSSPIPKLTWN